MVMTLTELTNAINRRIDDVIPQADAIEYMNAAKNRMGYEVRAKFPDLDTTNVTSFPFVFDDKWSELLVMFASARFKERDVMLDEARNFMAQFEDGLKYFVEYYEPIIQYKDDAWCQQFTAQTGQSAFVITKVGYDHSSANLKAYVNGLESTDFTIPTQSNTPITTTLAATNDPRGFVFNPTTTLNAGDQITALWEIHDDLTAPPYTWWKGAGW